MEENEYDDEKVIGCQKLLKVNEPRLSLSPVHRSIGALTFCDTKGNLVKGSAILISKDLILTAAHNIYCKNTKKSFNNFKFYLAANGVCEEYYEIESWRYPSEYESCFLAKKSQYDYAIMKLKDSKVGYKNFCQIALTCDKCPISPPEDLQLEIYGYPFDLSISNYTPHDKQGSKIELYQYGLTKTGKVNNLDPKNGKITYKISTLPGQSGSPVLCYGNVKAIHIGGGRSIEQFNVGKLITFQVAERLVKWCQELKAHQFHINNQTKCTHYRETSDSLESASELMIIGERLYQRKQYSLALEKFTKSLEIYQRIKGAGSLQTASALAFIGTVQNVLGNYQQAILSMTQAYQIYKNENRPKDIQYLKLLNNIGNTFYFIKNYSMSKEFYKDCAQCCEKTAIKDTIYPYSLSGLGGSYYFLNDFKEAASSFEKALPVYKSINAPANQCALWLCKCYKILNEQTKLAKLIYEEKVDSLMI